MHFQLFDKMSSVNYNYSQTSVQQWQAVWKVGYVVKVEVAIKKSLTLKRDKSMNYVLVSQSFLKVYFRLILLFFMF